MTRAAIIALVSVLLRTSAAGGIRHALAPALILMIVGSVILGGVGIPVPLIGRWFLESTSFRVLLLLGWALLFLPTARAIIQAPGARYLTQFPGAMTLRTAIVLVVLFTSVLPLGLLIYVGGGWVAAVLAMSWIVALYVVIAAPQFRWEKRALQIGIASAMIAVLYMHSAALWIGASACLSVGLAPGAIHRSDIESRRYIRRALIGGPFVSLLSLHFLHLWRCQRSLLVRVGFILAAGVVFMMTSWAANHGNDMDASIRLALAMQTPVLAMIGIILALAIRESIADSSWLLASLQVQTTTRVAAGWMLTALGCGGSAVIIALVTCQAIAGIALSWLMLCLLIHAVALSAWAHWLCHGRLSVSDNDRSRPAVLMFGLAIIVTVLISMMGHWLLVIEVMSVPLVWGYGAERRWQGA